MKKNFRTIILSVSLVILLCAAGLYGTFLFLLPAIVNSDAAIAKIETLINEKTGLSVKFDGLKFSTYPNLTSQLDIKKITAADVLKSDDISVSFAPFRLMPENVKIGYVFFDKTRLKTSAQKRKSSFNFNLLPSVTLKKADIILQKDSKNLTGIKLTDTALTPYKNKFILTFDSEISTNNHRNKISTGDDGYLYFENGQFFAQDFEIVTGNTKIYLDGKLFDNEQNHDFTVKGQNVRVNDIEKSFLFFIKQKNPGKNFIENFYDFSGLADLDLRIKNRGITGEAVINNLAAKTVKFSIPIHFPKAKFIFEGDKITTAAHGTFGGEKVFTDLLVTDLFSAEKRLVKGTVTSEVGEKFAKTYIPDLHITGLAGLSVKYTVHQRKVTVEYQAKINKGSNIYYRNADLGKEDDDRRIFAKTYKDGDKLYLKTYDYSFVNGAKVENIILGDGLFVKKNGRYTLDYLTCKTNGDAPVSVTGSFGKYIEGGTFNGNLRYDYPENLLTGNFSVKNSRYKDFYVSSASILADPQTMKIQGRGTFENANFTCDIDMINRFEDRITINNLNLYLEKYNIRKPAGTQKKTLKISEKAKDRAKDIEWEIKNGVLKLDRLTFRKILLENLELTGNLKNNMIEFSMPDIDFASGRLAASGTYDLNNHNADLCFCADDVDSNEAAGMIFNFPNQIEGYANAVMHAKIHNKLDAIDAHTEFFIGDGTLTKIGSTEFMIKKSKKVKRNLKFKISDIINVDINRMKALRSDIKGSFDLHNHEIKNAEIFAQQKYLSLYTEGDYNMSSEDANVTVWGRYNRSAQKGIRILFIPLSVVTKIIFRPEHTMAKHKNKIEKIPPVEAKPKEEELFTVRMNGNLNDNSTIKVELKSIK